MNRYGEMALEHNRQFRPEFFAEIPNPVEFFAQAGEEIEVAIAELRDQILGQQRGDEDLEQFRVRSYQALRTAEELVLADHHLLQPPEQSQRDPDTTNDPELAAYYRDLEDIDQTLLDVHQMLTARDD